MKAKDYQLIPMDDIDLEARKLAVLWVESDIKEMNWIGDKHKLASDFMNYAKSQNEKLTKENRKWRKVCKGYINLIQEVQESRETFKNKNKELIERLEDLKCRMHVKLKEDYPNIYNDILELIKTNKK